MQLPTIHTNGTDAETLVNDYMDAMDALLHAVNELERCAPNARDYYVNGGDIQIAMIEHADRIARIVTVRAEINQLAEHVADA